MKNTPATRDLFVADIPFETTEAELHQLFSLCGTVRLIKFLKDDQDNFKGLAFIRMSNDKESREAVNMLDGIKLGDRHLRISIARTKEEREPPATETIRNDRSRNRQGRMSRKKGQRPDDTRRNK